VVDKHVGTHGNKYSNVKYKYKYKYKYTYKYLKVVLEYYSSTRAVQVPSTTSLRILP